MLLGLQALFLISLLGQLQAGEEEDNRTLLHLLNILPFPDDQPNSGWDRAFELIPAAQLAVDLINNASDILPGYKLNLINVDSEACGINFINRGLVNTYAGVFNSSQSLNVVGLTGLFCSSVTDTIAPIFSIPDVAYLQLAASTTPMHRHSTRHPYLIHSISSSAIFNDAVFAMMRRFYWRKITIIDYSSGIIFASSAADFIQRAKEISQGIVPRSIPITTNTVREVLNVGNRIVYVNAVDSEIAKILCTAFQKQALYPGYVYLLRESSILEILTTADSTDCTSDQILEAIEGIFFLQYRLVAKEQAMLISNLTYREYHRKYISRLTEIESARNMTLDKSNSYANVMHDQIWAFALSLSSSLQTIKANNINLENLKLQQTQLLATILKRNILNVSFEGTSGFVLYNPNYEKSSVVDIFQVINRSVELVGVYDNDVNIDVNDSLQLLKDISLPPDTFEIRPHLIPQWQFIVINSTVVLCVVVTTLNLIFLLAFRKRPEVKASSPYLNLVTFTGCYFIFTATLMRNVSKSYQITNYDAYTLLCNMEVWLVELGIILIFSVLLMRLLRIRQIFRAHGKVGNYWKNEYLMMYIFVICFGGIAILALWITVDKMQVVTTIQYKPSATPPYFESRSVCRCDKLGIWMAILHSYIGILVTLVIFLAVQTRKIRLRRFKDTKKINAFIFTTCITSSILVTLWPVIEVAQNNEVGGHFIVCSALLSTAVYCQLFFFLPLIFAVLCESSQRRESQFSTAI